MLFRSGAAFLALPQDIQTYAFDFPTEMFEKRVWRIPRNRPDAASLATAAAWIKAAKRPVIFAGGGVRYSEAGDALKAFAEQTGIPVAETHAGKGSLPYDHPLSLGGAAGFQHSNLIDVISLPYHFWSLGPALAGTLFDGGLRTRLATFRSVLWPAGLLATVGVLITATSQPIDVSRATAVASSMGRPATSPGSVAAMRMMSGSWGASTAVMPTY